MKKIIGALVAIIFIGIGWYLFIKEYDYQFNFNGKFGPSTVYQEILKLENFKVDDSLYAIETISTTPYENIKQRISISDKDNLILDWNFKYENDSVTGITVNSLHTQNLLKTRLKILNPFSESDYITEMKNNLQDLKKQLKAHQNLYRISLHETGKNPEQTCACITSTSRFDMKANSMMATINKLQEFVVKNDLELQGPPLLKVQHWDREKNKITFDFCFPIASSNNIEDTDSVKLKKIKSQESLKAVFNGNYRNSQLAWLELLEKAERENIAVEALPLEIFFNNPGMGGDELKWRSEIYLPLKQ